MSAYYVGISYPSGHSAVLPAETLEQACEIAEEERAIPGVFSVSVCGDGAEGGYGDDGMGWHDGLTDDEREEVEARGLS